MTTAGIGGSRGTTVVEPDNEVETDSTEGVKEPTSVEEFEDIRAAGDLD